VAGSRAKESEWQNVPLWAVPKKKKKRRRRRRRRRRNLKKNETLFLYSKYE
jgi:hypothetical protein